MWHMGMYLTVLGQSVWEVTIVKVNHKWKNVVWKQVVRFYTELSLTASISLWRWERSNNAMLFDVVETTPRAGYRKGGSNFYFVRWWGMGREGEVSSNNSKKPSFLKYFLFHYCSLPSSVYLSERVSIQNLKVHKIENFFGSKFKFYTISLLVMLKY